MQRSRKNPHFQNTLKFKFEFKITWNFSHHSNSPSAFSEIPRREKKKNSKKLEKNNRKRENFTVSRFPVQFSTMTGEHSPTGGVKPFPIAGRYVSERERLAGMTDAERAWRAQWLKDQILSKHEPVHVPALERELLNPIRRFYRFPLDCVESMMKPVVVSLKLVLQLVCRLDDVTTTNLTLLGHRICARIAILLRQGRNWSVCIVCHDILLQIPSECE